MLKEYLNSIDFYGITPDRNFFHPISDREYWDDFSEKYLDKIIEQYEKITAEPRGELTASLYLDYTRTNNRTRFETVYERRRDELLFATLIECCRNDGALMDDILDLTWMILEETSWCYPAHNKSVAISDVLPYHKQWSITICSTKTAVKLAFVYQVIGEKLDEISKMVTLRIKDVIKEKVLSEMLNRDDYWWMGFGNKIPNNIGVWNWRNAMIAALIVVDDMNFLRKFIMKAILCIDQYIDNQGECGGCDEGSAYWFLSHGNVIETIEVMNRATNGAFTDCYKSEKIRNMSYFLLKTYAGGKYFVNFADSTGMLDKGALFLYRCGRILGIEDVCDFAAEWGRVSGQTNPINGETEMYRMLENFKYFDEYMSHKSDIKTVSEFYLQDLGIMTVRTQSKNGEMFVAAKAGHNGESHNHNDVGNFIVYKNGVRFVVDSGPMTYSALTFSDQRYTLWTNQSQYHNLPTINGYCQKETSNEPQTGEVYKSDNVEFKKEDKTSALSMSIKNSYENRNEIRMFDRCVSIEKELGKVSVTDTFNLENESEVIWNFLTPQKPEWNGKEIILSDSNGETLRISAKGEKFSFEMETINLEDAQTRRTWGEKLYRTKLSAKVSEGEVVFEIK